MCWCHDSTTAESNLMVGANNLYLGPKIASVVVCSKAFVLLFLFIHCVFLLSLCIEVLCLAVSNYLFSYIVLCVIFSYAIISVERRELAALL